MGRSKKRYSAPLLPLVVAALLASAWAREDIETFEDAAQVVEVQVPINVVDRDGAPIRDLTAEDFEIFDDGKRRPVTGFEVIDLEVLAPGEEDSKIDTINAAARRHFLLLFDLSFSTPTSILKARAAAQEFVLNSLHPVDLAAVATFSLEQGTQLLVTFTPDRAQLARAIDTMGARSLLDPFMKRDPLRFLIENPDSAAAGSASSTLIDNSGGTDTGGLDPQQALVAHLTVIGKQMQKMERSFARGRIGSWAGALGDMAKVLNSVQGRKQVVYFAEGFDGRLMLGRAPDASDPEHQSDQFNLETGQYWMVDTDDIYGNTSLTQVVGAMLEEFRRADCVIQAVDISGMGSETAAEKRVRDSTQAALFYMANETGGELFEDANNLSQQLSRVLQRSTVTYVLTFKADDVAPDGAYHRLRVKTASLPRSARVSHRSGYYAPRPFEDLHPLEKSLLASDAIASAAPRRDVELDVLAAPFRANEQRAYVPIIIEVGGSSLLAGHEKDEMTAEFYTYVSDKKGAMKDFFTQQVSLDLSQGKARQVVADTGVKYYGHLDLEPGDYLVRVLVRNADTGRTGVSNIAVSVPRYTESLPQLLPPFFLEAPGRWIGVREQRRNYQTSIVYPFTINGEPYIPAARPMLNAGEAAQLCLVAYNLGSGQVELEGSIVAADGAVIEVEDGLDLVERTLTGIKGLDKLLATFQPQALASGDYTLKVAITDPTTGDRLTNSIPFSVLPSKVSALN